MRYAIHISDKMQQSQVAHALVSFRWRVNHSHMLANSEFPLAGLLVHALYTHTHTLHACSH